MLIFIDHHHYHITICKIAVANSESIKGNSKLVLNFLCKGYSNKGRIENEGKDSKKKNQSIKFSNTRKLL